jgi:hypothetical protein
VAIVNTCRFVDLGSIHYKGGAVKIFLTFEFNYINICRTLCRCIERKPELVAHVWSQLIRLTARMIFPKMPLKKRHLQHLRRQSMLPLPSLLHNAKAACLRSGINLPASTRHSGRTTFQCKFVNVLIFFKKITT